MSVSREKWPVHFEAKRVTSSIIGQELVLYFVAVVANQEQIGSLKDHMKVLAEFEIDSDKYAALSILGCNQIDQLLQAYEPVSKEWRGQWYALANAVVDGCREALK